MIVLYADRWPNGCLVHRPLPVIGLCHMSFIGVFSYTRLINIISSIKHWYDTY